MTETMKPVKIVSLTKPDNEWDRKFEVSIDGFTVKGSLLAFIWRRMTGTVYEVRVEGATITPNQERRIKRALLRVVKTQGFAN